LTSLTLTELLSLLKTFVAISELIQSLSLQLNSDNWICCPNSSLWI